MVLYLGEGVENMDAPIYFLLIEGVTPEITYMINPQSKASCGLFASI